jgi:hypothetical protein
MSLLGKWRKSEHQWVEESLSAYLDGELSSPDRARVEKHLQQCEACAENLATLRQTVSLLKELPVVQAPRSFAVRRAAVEVKRAAPPAWGYGLLKGATALAALLLVLLIGGDLALHFVGAPMAYFAPAAPAAEVALAPSVEPELAPAPGEEEPLLGQTKAAEPSDTEVPPENAEEAPAPVAEPTEAVGAYEAPHEMASPAARAEDAGPAATPTAAVPSGAGIPVEGEGVGGGEPVTATAAPATPAPSTTDEETVQPAAEPEATVPAPEWTEERATAPAPTPTPPAIAMAEAPQRQELAQELGGEPRGAGALPLSPLRLAEIIALALLVLLGAATALTAWLRRRSG